MSSGVFFEGRVRSRTGFAAVADPRDGRADTFPGFWRWDDDTGGAGAFFLLTGPGLDVELARAAFGGFEAFRGAALGDGSDRGAAERFFAIYQWSATACAENHEFSMAPLRCRRLPRSGAPMDSPDDQDFDEPVGFPR